MPSNNQNLLALSFASIPFGVDPPQHWRTVAVTLFSAVAEDLPFDPESVEYNQGDTPTVTSEPGGAHNSGLTFAWSLTICPAVTTVTRIRFVLAGFDNRPTILQTCWCEWRSNGQDYRTDTFVYYTNIPVGYSTQAFADEESSSDSDHAPADNLDADINAPANNSVSGIRSAPKRQREK